MNGDGIGSDGAGTAPPASPQRDHSAASIGARMRAVRAGRPQKVVAEILGLHQTSVSKIEAGDRSLDAQEIVAFCRAFDVEERWLLRGEGSPPHVTVHFPPTGT